MNTKPQEREKKPTKRWIYINTEAYAYEEENKLNANEKRKKRPVKRSE